MSISITEDAFLDNKAHWYPLRERVVTHSFELPKSSVPPPRVIPEAAESCSDDIPLGKSPRPPKKTKVSYDNVINMFGSRYF